MKRARYISMVLGMLLLVTFLANCHLVEAARDKSSVLLVFNDQSGRGKEERLSEIAHEVLNRKINGLYEVVDSKQAEMRLAEDSHYEEYLPVLLSELEEYPATYVIYVELLPFKQVEGFNIIWHRKKMTANIGLRIIDKKNSKEIFHQEYNAVREDDTDYFFVGSSSMARKSLKGALFTVGEAISVHLPL